MKNREYIIVHRIDKTTPLDKHIPLHMTALHWFESDLSPEQLAAELEGVIRNQPAVLAYATREDMFGPNKDVPVMRLERTPELLNLHLTLVEMAHGCDAVLEERWTGENNWNPHVTHQPEGRLNSGDEVQIIDLELITKRDDGMRQSVAVVRLGEA